MIGNKHSARASILLLLGALLASVHAAPLRSTKITRLVRKKQVWAPIKTPTPCSQCISPSRNRALAECRFVQASASARRPVLQAMLREHRGSFEALARTLRADVGAGAPTWPGTVRLAKVPRRVCTKLLTAVVGGPPGAGGGGSQNKKKKKVWTSNDGEIEITEGPTSNSLPLASAAGAVAFGSGRGRGGGGGGGGGRGGGRGGGGGGGAVSKATGGTQVQVVIASKPHGQHPSVADNPHKATTTRFDIRTKRDKSIDALLNTLRGGFFKRPNIKNKYNTNTARLAKNAERRFSMWLKKKK